MRLASAIRSFCTRLIFIGRGAISARIQDFLLTHFDLDHVLRQLATRIPQVDLKSQRVAPRLAVEDPLQWRVGDKPAVPIILAVDLCSEQIRAAASRWP